MDEVADFNQRGDNWVMYGGNGQWDWDLNPWEDYNVGRGGLDYFNKGKSKGNGKRGKGGSTGGYKGGRGKGRGEDTQKRREMDERKRCNRRWLYEGIEKDKSWMKKFLMIMQ